jgi:hypothetical protein
MPFPGGPAGTGIRRTAGGRAYDAASVQAHLPPSPPARAGGPPPEGPPSEGPDVALPPVTTAPPPHVRFYRQARRVVTDPRGLGVLQVGPRTLGFLAASWTRSRRWDGSDGRVAAPLSPVLALQVALDELVVSMMKDPARYPRRADYLRAAAETERAYQLYGEQGWLDDPASYHPTPDPLGNWRLEPDRAGGLHFERLSFTSGYEPHPDEPGRDRWLAHAENRTAHAWVLRHRHGNRPWLVCIHGFGMGAPSMDFRGFRAAQLYHRLGLNLIFPVLPMHGPRAEGRSGEGLMSFDLIDSVHGMAQAMWDIRRVTGWLRGLGAGTLGVYGLSLGGYTTALLASLDHGLACAIAGIPATDIPDLYFRHASPRLRERASEHHLLGEKSEAVHSVVSPLTLTPAVPQERRFIFAGLGDRMAPPSQAHKLWLHWDRPRIRWYGGGHIGFFWSREVGEFVQDALVSSGLDGRLEAEATS